MTLFVGIQSGNISLFRGNPLLYSMKVLDASGTPITLDAGGSADLVVTTSLTPDSASVLHTFTDFTVNTSDDTLNKVFSAADTEALPLGSFFGEIHYTVPSDATYTIAQIQVNTYPTQRN